MAGPAVPADVDDEPELVEGLVSYDPAVAPLLLGALEAVELDAPEVVVVVVVEELEDGDDEGEPD